LGADGPCLSKDPQILRYYANRVGVDTKVIDACILKNRESTLRIASVTSQFLSKYKIQRPKVSLIGLAFKGSPETDDIRDAPAMKIYRALIKEINNIEFKYYDPIVKKFSTGQLCRTLKECIKNTNVAMFLTNHSALMNIGLDSILSNSGRPLLIIDCWRNIADPYQLQGTDVQIVRIGDGRI
jgi:UDP-N-acetyl-D-mannosaminuronate dehydrogenase